MTKIIFDTNIFYSAIGWDGKILNLIYEIYSDRNCQTFLSDVITLELKNKIRGEKFKKLTNNKIADSFIDTLLMQIIANSTIVNPKTKLSICRDPKDNIFLELAKEVQADYLITGDNDLLALNKFENTEILKPSQFIEKFDLNL